jgi:hypothetical protein
VKHNKKKLQVAPLPSFLALPPTPDTTLTKADVIFPASVRHLMPRREDIPANYPRKGEWQRFQYKWWFKHEWFFGDPDDLILQAKTDFEPEAVLRHLACIQHSFEPKQEDKVATVAWLASLWLDESVLGGAT